MTLFIVFGATARAGWEEVDPKASALRLPGVVISDVPSYAMREHESRGTVDFICHFAGWDGDVYFVESTYCFADFKSASNVQAGWTATTPSEAFRLYGALDGVRTFVPAPKIETVLGEASVVRFNAFYDMADDYNCVGLLVQAERSFRFFKKYLDVYICNEGSWPLPVDTAMSVLRNMSVAGGFNALIR